MLTPNDLSAVNDNQVKKLRKELQLGFEKDSIQDRPVDNGVKSLVADFLCREEKIIIHLSDMAIRLYQRNKIRLYRQVLEVRDALMLKMDDNTG